MGWDLFSGPFYFSLYNIFNYPFIAAYFKLCPALLNIKLALYKIVVINIFNIRMHS